MKITVIRQTGPEIVVDARYNEEMNVIITKIQQMLAMPTVHLCNHHGKEIPGFTRIRGDITLYLEAPPIAESLTSC